MEDRHRRLLQEIKDYCDYSDYDDAVEHNLSFPPDTLARVNCPCGYILYLYTETPFNRLTMHLLNSYIVDQCDICFKTTLVKCKSCESPLSSEEFKDTCDGHNFFFTDKYQSEYLRFKREFYLKHGDSQEEPKCHGDIHCK